MFKNEKFCKMVYFAHGATGTGASANDAKPISDGDVWAIEAGSVIQEVHVCVTTAITGTTQVDIGDDDDANGFVAAATLTDGAVSVGAGAYLDSAGADLAKLYEASGKEVKLDATGASTAGAFVVVIQGYKI